MDQKELKALYEKYNQGLYFYLLKLTRSEERAQDLLQDTFIRIFRSLDLKKIKTNEKSYIYKIAYNMFLDSRKKGKLNITHSTDDIDIRDTATSFVDDVHWQILKDSIIKKLNENNEKFSTAFILRVDLNMSQAEIAKVMDIPFSTLRNHFEKIQNIILLNFRDELKLNL